MISTNKNRSAKDTKAMILTDLCNLIDLKKETITGQIPHGVVAGVVASHKTVCPWITRDVINNELRRQNKMGIFNSPLPSDQVTTSVTDLVIAATDSFFEENCVRTKGGRPAGTSDLKKRHGELAVTASKNEIATMFQSEKKSKERKNYFVVNY